jgi:hypothetical protein
MQELPQELQMTFNGVQEEAISLRESKYSASTFQNLKLISSSSNSSQKKYKPVPPIKSEFDLGLIDI